MPADPQKARELFLHAVGRLPPAQWDAYVADACGGDAELGQQVGQLLRVHGEAGSFLDRPAAGVGVTGAFAPPPNNETATRRPDECAGMQIGPYKLLQQIGQGGMGTVFMAEQTEPVRRKIALKVIKVGMDSRQVIARFEAERQALAMMDHVNIARVLDAGATASGQPYFVMELVHGVPITKYCDDNHLTPRERLELFVPVCQAIQHAHQKGIIHRDIKPSNVMVTLYDGKPVPKVIDFGVAKATEQKLTERTLFTQYGTLVGTLEYMSPEQAEMSALGVDTRSDIYSLGVLLYELLTGSTPLSHKRLKEAAYAEILRMIKEEEPPKPSTRLSDSGEALASISAQRHMEPAKLTKLMRGELDWIVMKTLEKDRNRRYETAKDFAADVQRYLSDETVQACPPSAGYRLRKFARRNRSGLAVAGLVLFFLVLLGSGAGWAWRDRAARARETELERVARAAEQANHLERAVERAELLQREGRRGEASAALERARLLAREAEPASPLAERIESLQQLLDAEGRDEVFVAQFDAIRREVQTEMDVEKNVSSSKKGYPRIREALEQYGIALGVTPPATAVTHIQKRPAAIQTVVVAALHECFLLVHGEDSGARAWLIDVLQKADNDPWRNKVRRAWNQPATLEPLVKDIDVRQQPPSFLLSVAGWLPIESPSRLDLARRVQFAYPGDYRANHGLGWNLDYVGKHAEAIRYYTAALSLRPDHPGVLLNRASALRHVGELEAAVADLQRAIAVAPRYTAAYNNLGTALYEQKKLPEAIAAYKKAIELDPKDAMAHYNLGRVLIDQKKLDAAIACFKTAIELDPKDRDAPFLLGNALRAQKKVDEAIAAYRKAIEIDPKFAGAHYALGVILCDDLRDYENAAACFRKVIELHPKHANAYVSLGNALMGQKKLDEAIACYRKAIELDPKLTGAHSNLGIVLVRQRKLDEAIACYRKAIELDPKFAAAHNNLGIALHEQKKLDEAIACYRKAIELDPKDAGAHSNLGTALRAQKKLDEAIAAYRTAIELDPKNAPAYSNLGSALCGQGKLDEAIAAYRKAIEIDPRFAAAHNNLGLALSEQKKLDEAIAAYRKAIELDPKLAAAHDSLGTALRAQKKLDEAIVAYRKAIEINPKSADAYCNLGGLLCDDLKDYDKAIECFRTAIKLDPKHANAYGNLGNALRNQQQLPEAIAAYRKAIEIDPRHFQSHQSLALALATAPDPKVRDPRLAVEHAKKAVELEPQPAMSLQVLGWVQYCAGAWRESIEALEKSCKLQSGGTGDGGQWIVLALAHAKLAAQEGLPQKEREHHKIEARRRYEQADKQIDSWWRARPGDVGRQVIWDFREEARELMGVKESKK